MGVPIALLNALIFIWIFLAIHGLLKALSERGLNDDKSRLTSTRKVLIFALVVACINLFFQLLDILRIFEVDWRYNWILSGGVSHIVFVFVLIFMMILWKPSIDLQ